MLNDWYIQAHAGPEDKSFKIDIKVLQKPHKPEK